jgi:hypothetical protein
MAVLTVAHLLTSLIVFSNKCARSPVRTSSKAVVNENCGVSPEVLVIMSIWALGLVVLLVEWTPLRFVVEHEEIFIFLHLVNQSHLKLLVAVSKRAVVLIFTLVQVLRKLGTVFSLVLLRVVDALDSVVG